MDECGAELYEQERDTAAVFQELPFHYVEIAHILLRHAKDCFSDLYKVLGVPLPGSSARRTMFSKPPWVKQCR